MADDDINILREIDDALKADRMLQLWNRHRGMIIGGCTAVVLGTALSVAWRHYSDGRAQDATRQMIAAQVLQDAGKHKEAAAAFSQVAEKYSKEAPLARLKQGQALVLAGEKDQAADVFSQADKDKGLAAAAHMAKAFLGKASEAELRAQAEANQPFRFTAKEQLALLLIKQGKKKEAAALLTELMNDPLTPSTMRARAAQLLPEAEG